MNQPPETIEPVKPLSMYSDEEKKLLSRCNQLEDKNKNLEKTRDDYIKLWEMNQETLEHNNKTLDILSKKTFLEIWLTNNNNTMKLLITIIGSGVVGYVIALFS